VAVTWGELLRGTCFSLSRRAELALSRLPRRPTNLSGFAAACRRARGRRRTESQPPAMNGGELRSPRQAKACPTCFNLSLGATEAPWR